VAAEESNTEAVLAVSTDDQLIRQLTERAQAQGLSLTGEDGLLRQLTKLVLEAGLEAEMNAHLGYEKHQVEGRNGENSRNGVGTKTLLTEVGPVEIEVPRDREGTFTPTTVRKRQRRMGGVDSMVISLVAKGMTTGDVQAHLAEIYGTEVSRETISNITDQVMEKMAEWQSRPLDPVYPVVFVDAINVKIRDGQVANRPVYVALGVTVTGHKDVLGLWVGDGGEGAKYWLRVMTELKNRGVNDICIMISDGLNGMTEAIEATWPQTIHQTCVVHLLRNSFAYASKADWGQIAKDLKPVYTAKTEAAALDRFLEFTEKWEATYPAIIRLWTNAWAQFVPFLNFDVEIRKIICTTNAIESVNSRYRRAIGPRRHFPNENAALKCLYLATMGLDPTGKGRQRWVTRWKPALNAFEIVFDGRLSAGRQL
jgi:transposase-like protein